MLLAFGIEDLSLVVGVVCALFHADSKRFLVCFQDLHLEVFFYLLCPMFNISWVLPLKKFQFKHFFASYRAVHVVVASVLASTLG